MDVSPEWLRLRSVATAAARAGGKAALAHFRRPGLAVEWKADESPVTRADRESEAAVRAVIAAAYPDDAWLGEETGASERLGPGSGPVSGRRWIVDPVDGTRNFVRGIPFWSVLIACEEDLPGGSRIVASAVAFPALGEWYDAALGGGARCNDEPIHVSAIATLAEAGFAYYTFEWFRKYGLEAVFRELSGRTAMQRGGGDAYMHMLVASGRAEVCVEPGLQVWDIAASSLVVAEAGGRVTDLAGGTSLRSGNAILTNGHLHTEVVALVHRLKDL